MLKIPGSSLIKWITHLNPGSQKEKQHSIPLQKRNNYKTQKSEERIASWKIWFLYIVANGSDKMYKNLTIILGSLDVDSDCKHSECEMWMASKNPSRRICCKQILNCIKEHKQWQMVTAKWLSREGAVRQVLFLQSLMPFYNHSQSK